ncbi:MAG: hypothetical protein JJ974_08925 [Phycisphaerales bacterium]|nr:hypothetical protein [Phycisphaerales bacterium]
MSVFVSTLVIGAVSVQASSAVMPREIMHPDMEHSMSSLMSSMRLDDSVSIFSIDQIAPKVSMNEMIEMRGQGADVELIERDDSIPAFSIAASGEGLFVDPDAIGRLFTSGDGLLSPGDNMHFIVGRSTSLSDGDISGSGGSLPGSGDSVATMTQSEGEYNFYEMALEWTAASTGSVDFSLISGVTAIQANVSKRVQSGGSSTLYDVTNRVVAVPTIGSAVRWNISRDWSLTGQATTQTLGVGSSLVGFNAQTDLRISDRVGLVAGYQILRSEFDLGAVTTDLNQEGLFARLSIEF